MDSAGWQARADQAGFALLLKFHLNHGRFPRGRSELGDDVVAYVAAQVRVPPSDIAFYEWDGRTIEYHRAQIRGHTGFRECTATDAEKITAWLAGHVCQSERRAERVRAALLEQLKSEGIEPPAASTPAPDRRVGAAGGRTDVDPCGSLALFPSASPGGCWP